MGFILAPYNNAMRLGQGFNSYTQEICVDDAVIADPGRPLNPLTNDGTTMVDLRMMMQGPSAYGSIKNALMGSVVDDIPITGHEDDDEVGESNKELDTIESAVDVKDGDDVSQTETPTTPPTEEETVPAPEDEDDEEKSDDEDGQEEEESGSEGVNEEKRAGKSTGAEGSKSAVVSSKKSAKLRAVEKQKAKEKAEKEQEEREKKAKDAQDEKERKVARAKVQAEEEKRYKAAEKRAREATTTKPYTKAERDAWLGKVAPASPRKDASATTGVKTRTYEYKPTGARGPAQIVTYKSSFVEKLSDITDDMNISGALSIKYGAIGGSGRGAFVNSDKFHDSDLNFYVSVKVINQTTNMKDALVYQPLRSVEASNFREVYGDSFISGFLEGGEFNAIVSMKVLNKSQMTKIKAEAKVALTVGIAEVSAEAAVDIAKKNITNNTETTIQVSWSGGGFIKPIDEPWDIESLMSAAARFPDLVAVTPQRTYAILTKYETLRSFVKLKPEAFSPMQYECAQLYTSMLMDTYMDYKAILKRLSSNIFDVENGISVIQSNPRSKKGPAVTKQDKKSDVDDETPFEVSLGGLDRARRACRFQMVRLVNEVDEITKSPKKATDEDRLEPFQAPRVFKDRLPLVKLIAAAPSNPLSNEKILPGADRRYGSLCPELEQLEDQERLAVVDINRDRPDIARFFRLTKPVGSTKNGTPFNALEYLKHSVTLTSVKVGVAQGVVVYLQVQYSNGLQCLHGASQQNIKYSSLEDIAADERVIACSVETGEVKEDADADVRETGEPETRITRLKLYTNRGRSLVAQADGIDEAQLKRVDKRGERNFRDLRMTNFDPVMENSYIKGFWGYSQNGLYGTAKDGLWRIGVIWGNDLKPEPPVVDEEDENKKKKKKGKN